MKKILFVIASLKQGGGAEKICSTIGTKLKEEGYDIHFLTFYDFPKEKLYPFEGKYFSLNEKQIKNTFQSFIKLIKRSIAIKKYCKKNKIQTSISFMEEANFPNSLSKILFKNKTKTIVSIRQSIKKAYKNKKLYQILIKFLYPKVNKTIVVSYEEKENLSKNFKIPIKDIKVIYNPINFEYINNQKKENLGEYENIFSNKKFTFINVGRLTYQKNQLQLIKAFKKINKKNPNTQLIIIGDGELKKKLKKEIGNNKNIFLLGLQKNPYKFLVRSDCFIFPSLWEGFPNALIEALSLGLVVISSDCSTGPCEILRENQSFYKTNSLEITDYGILFPTGNEKELFKAMKKIYLDKNLRKNLEKKSLERSKDFDLEKIIKKWKKII